MKIVKFIVLITLGFALTSLVTAESNEKKKKKLLKQNVVITPSSDLIKKLDLQPSTGFTSNIGGNSLREAVAYNYEQTSTTETDKMVKQSGISPKIVDKLPTERFEKSEKIDPEFTVSNDDYYDGTKTFSARQQNCKQYSNNKDKCLTVQHCGYCIETNSCVPGLEGKALNGCKSFKFLPSPSTN